MNINKIREALYWLNDHVATVRGEGWGSAQEKIREALAELDKAQPLAEPVAWMVRTRIGVEWVTTLGVTETGARQIAIERYRNGSDVQNMDPIPIYAHPPQAQQPCKMLTDDMVNTIANLEKALYIRENCSEKEADIWARGVMSGLIQARDNGYLSPAPAAGLTVEEAEQIAVDARIEIDEIAWKSPPISYEKEFRSILKRRLNEKLKTKNQ